jgi:hypothetical protein
MVPKDSDPEPMHNSRRQQARGPAPPLAGPEQCAGHEHQKRCIRSALANSVDMSKPASWRLEGLHGYGLRRASVQ